MRSPMGVPGPTRVRRSLSSRESTGNLLLEQAPSWDYEIIPYTPERDQHNRPIAAGLLSGPSAVDRQIGSGDLGGGIGAEVDGKRGHLLDGDEFLGRLRLEENVVLDLFGRHVARLHRVRDLLFDQRGPDIAGADAIRGDAEGRDFERDRLGEAGESVLRRH